MLTEEQEENRLKAMDAMPISIKQLSLPRASLLTYKAIGTQVLYSYGVPVAIRENQSRQWFTSPAKYSKNTSRHIHELTAGEVITCSSHADFCDLLRAAAAADAKIQYLRSTLKEGTTP